MVSNASKLQCIIGIIRFCLVNISELTYPIFDTQAIDTQWCIQNKAILERPYFVKGYHMCSLYCIHYEIGKSLKSKYLQTLHLLTFRVVSIRLQICEFDNAWFLCFEFWFWTRLICCTVHSYIHFRNRAFIYPLLKV